MILVFRFCAPPVVLCYLHSLPPLTKGQRSLCDYVPSFALPCLYLFDPDQRNGLCLRRSMFPDFMLESCAFFQALVMVSRAHCNISVGGKETMAHFVLRCSTSCGSLPAMGVDSFECVSTFEIVTRRSRSHIYECKLRMWTCWPDARYCVACCILNRLLNSGTSNVELI